MSLQTNLLVLIAASVLGGVALVAWTARGRRLRQARRAFVLGYAFPAELRRRIGAGHPEWTFAQIDRVLEALREYFLACLSAQRGHRLARTLGVPSKAMDHAWHEFIVMTREYADFCQRAFGRYLHHTPHALMADRMEDALANTLHHVRASGPVPLGAWAAGAAAATAMPLVFALDRELGLPSGYIHDDDSMRALEERRRHLFTQAGGGSADGGVGHCAAGDGGSSCADGGGSCGGGGCGGGGCGGG